jgi:hypothetical protein
MVGASTSAELERLLAWAFPGQEERLPQLRASYVLREHAIVGIDRALSARRLDALLAKGAATSSMYPAPYRREMADVDLLVDPDQLHLVCDALRDAGWSDVGSGDRPLSGAQLELAFRSPAPASMLVELHVGLDKVAPRPAMTRALMARSHRSPGLRALWVPSPDDQMALVVVHLANDGFVHRAGYVDLQVLLERGASLQRLVTLSRELGISTAAYLALRYFATLASHDVPRDVLDALAPAPWRKRVIARSFPEAIPTSKPAPNVVAWLVGQAALRDDTLDWLSGVARYSGARARERMGGWTTAWRPSQR